MFDLISGKDLMERWGISPYELLSRFIKKGLIAYDETGKEVSPVEAIHGTDDPRSDVQKIISWSHYELPGSEAEAQRMIEALGNLYFDKNNVEGIGDTFFPARPKKSNTVAEPDKPKPSDKHPRRRHKKQTQAVAKDLWDKHPAMTVPEMIKHAEISKMSQREDGSLYLEKTVKSWIKDLNPNEPLKGRPKKKDK